MGFRIIPPKRVRKVKTKNSQEVLRRLEEYLEGNCNDPAQILCGFWKDQQDAITYQEIRQAVLDGTISQETVDLWMQDYSILVTDRLSSMWTNAIAAGSAGQPILDGLVFEFNTQSPGILRWIRDRGAEFVTACTQEQKDAIAALVTKKMKDSHTVDELARLIRPCIGLTEGQAKANARYYDNIVASLKKDHPRMKSETIRKKALTAAQKYAERQHRERAFTIARTESAFAYNRGADEGIRQAQAEGYLGVMVKRWSTSGDDAVCDTCAALDGVEVSMDADFNIGGRLLFVGQHMLPPAHPRCACAIEYIETDPQASHDIPEIKTPITESNSFREYSTEEIESMARQTEEIAAKHIAVPSKWSGKIVVDDDSDIIGKLWNCDIQTRHETAPHMLLHEQIHARSISYYKENTYKKYRNIEEASVQFMTQEISMKEGIEIIDSFYDDNADVLRMLGRKLGNFNTDYDFAKTLIEISVTERLVWLSERLYATMRMDENATLQDYKDFSKLLDRLY